MTPARNYVQTFDRSPEEYRISKTLLISEQDFVRFESHSIHCDWVRKVSGSEKASKLLRSPYRKGRDQKHSTTLNDLTRKGHKLVLDLLSRVVFCLRISALSYDHVELSKIQICPREYLTFPQVYVSSVQKPLSTVLEQDCRPSRDVSRAREACNKL